MLRRFEVEKKHIKNEMEGLHDAKLDQMQVMCDARVNNITKDTEMLKQRNTTLQEKDTGLQSENGILAERLKDAELIYADLVEVRIYLRHIGFVS